MQPVDARTSQEQQQAARVGLAAGPAAVTVELAGAVVEPGLYQFSAQTRLGQAIDQAGGLSKKADRQQAAQQINLARVVEDGEKIYLPFKLESSFAKQLSQWCQQNGNPTSDFSNQQQNPADSPNSSSQACISLNQANSDQLQELNGIGPKRAEDIVAARPYQQVQDLVTKEVLSESIFSDIKNELCL
jgi:competence protein ComEA